MTMLRRSAESPGGYDCSDTGHSAIPALCGPSLRHSSTLLAAEGSASQRKVELARAVEQYVKVDLKPDAHKVEEQ